MEVNSKEYWEERGTDALKNMWRFWTEENFVP